MLLVRENPTTGTVSPYLTGLLHFYYLLSDCFTEFFCQSTKFILCMFNYVCVLDLCFALSHFLCVHVCSPKYLLFMWLAPFSMKLCSFILVVFFVLIDDINALILLHCGCVGCSHTCIHVLMDVNTWMLMHVPTHASICIN